MRGYGIQLAMATPGKLVTVTGFRGGFGLQRRLADMGLTPGVQVKVINTERHGPVLIELRGSRLALGRGVTRHILVEES
jgi:ferrous iron transport protein A